MRSEAEVRQLILSDPPNLAVTFYDMWQRGLIAHEHMARYVHSVWSYADQPHQALSDDEWRTMFRAAGYTCNGEPAEPRPRRLYRGSPATFKRNWSWTPSRYVATQFNLRRGHSDCDVWAIDAPASSQLSHHRFGDGYEEIICDTDGLRIYRADEIDAVTLQRKRWATSRYRHLALR
ncbi:hypothetical protein BHQ17_00070 [Mycolicibacterium holsaticum]|uniref:Uncharacterized protein n=1 Tax=Mycolicibacterium holsaticum TaxID=152142 RepID=A0A1E3S341_9MYCO|nr:hypothetical protein BHQ17_00070 [Mycolicibacterium holsaticum]